MTAVATQIPTIGQPWPEQGGVYIGARLVNGETHHIIIAGGVEYDIEASHNNAAERIAAKGEINGHSDWRHGSQEDVMLAYINARDLFPREGYDSIQITATPFGSRSAWAVGFERGSVIAPPEPRVPGPPLPQIITVYEMDSGYSFELLVQAYFDCRRLKRNTASALRFEQDLERNLLALHEELIDGSYRPGRSICFVITKPKPREVWAADFRDRIVHHLLYNHIADRFIRRFIADSCACIPGRGTLYAAQRLEAKIRSQTQNWSRPGHYLKADLANFFVSIEKRILWPMVARRIPERWWRDLAKLILFHDPRADVDVRGERELMRLVPPHKRLFEAPPHCGLPIGNLSSQFFANILLDALDQHVKHAIRARHYIRYVDDLVVLHESPQWLNEALAGINEFLPTLHLALNPRKTVIQPIHRGVDFAGHVIKPWRRQVRRRTVRAALSRIEHLPDDETLPTINSYLGLMRHTDGYRDRALIALAARMRGHTIAWDATKSYAKGETNMTLQDHVAAVFDAAHRCERAYVELCGNPTSHAAQSDHNLARQQLDHALNALADHCRARDCEIERLSLDLREAKIRHDDFMQKALGAAQ